MQDDGAELNSREQASGEKPNSSSISETIESKDKEPNTDKSGELLCDSSNDIRSAERAMSFRTRDVFLKTVPGT